MARKLQLVHGREVVIGVQRGCGTGGAKRYPTPADARRYAAAFDREDREDLGRRAPLVAGLPLRLVRWARDRGRAQRDPR